MKTQLATTIFVFGGAPSLGARAKSIIGPGIGIFCLFTQAERKTACAEAFQRPRNHEA